MVKLKGPLNADSASGTLANALVFSSCKGRAYARAHVVPVDPATQAQTSKRIMLKFLSQEWTDLFCDEQKSWGESPHVLPLAPYHLFIAKNLARWENFRTPGKVYPVAEILRFPGRNPPVCVGGVGTITTTLTNNPAHERWGCLIFRDVDHVYEPSLDTIKMVVLLSDTPYTTVVETNVPAGIWRVMDRPFTPDGVFNPFPDHDVVTVT